jgi:hypothetical protein
MRSHVALVLLLAACGGVADDGGSAAERTCTNPDPLQVASVRLVSPEPLGDQTDHVRLDAGVVTPIEVRLYQPSGCRITPVTGPVDVTFTFSPDTLATSAPVTNQPLARDVTVTSVPGSLGTLSVTLSFPNSMTAKTFGAFEVLIH